jgi:hypothetical protein
MIMQPAPKALDHRDDTRNRISASPTVHKIDTERTTFGM